VLGDLPNPLPAQRAVPCLALARPAHVIRRAIVWHMS
jgi:hypothetical protein